MAGLRAPGSFTAGRRLKLNGTTYQPGDTVPKNVVKGLRRLSALVSGRWLIPNLTQRAGKRASTTRPTPESFPPSLRKKI